MKHIPRIETREPDECMYPNMLRTMADLTNPRYAAIFGPVKTLKQSLKDCGMDDSAVEAWMNIKQEYENTLRQAENRYAEAVGSEDNGPLEILDAYEQRIREYAAAAQTMTEKLNGLSLSTGLPVLG